MKEKTAQAILKNIKLNYQIISEEFDKTRKNKWEEFESFMPYIQNNKTVADLGCGNGRFYKFIKNKRKIKYTGIDNCEKLLQKAKEEHQTKKLQKRKTQQKANFIIGDLLKLPIENNSMDIVVSIASLHHIPSTNLREKALKEIKRIIKKNGTLIITVWNLFQPKYKKYTKQALLRHFLTLGKYDKRDTFIPWGKGKIKRYYYAFTPKELEDLIKRTGFQVIKKTIQNNITFICKT